MDREKYDSNDEADKICVSSISVIKSWCSKFQSKWPKKSKRGLSGSKVSKPF